MEIPGIHAALQDTDVMMKIVDHVTTGGSVIELSHLWDVPYRVLIRFLRSDPCRNKLYTQALEDRKEWAIERLLGELRNIACVDMTQILDDNGCLKPTDTWPEDAKQNLKKIIVKEIFDDKGNKEGELKTVEFHAKLRAIELYGKQLQMFMPDVKSGDGRTLEELLSGSRATDK